MKNGVKVVGNSIIITFNGAQTIRDINNIRFYTSCHNYTEIYFNTDKPVIAPIGINKLALLLPDKSFYQCHRLYIIHFGILQKAIVKEGKIIYRKHILPVSRNKIREFRDKAEAYHHSVEVRLNN